MYYLSSHISFLYLKLILDQKSFSFIKNSGVIRNKYFSSLEGHLIRFYSSPLLSSYYSELKNKKPPFIYKNHIFFNRNKDGTLTKESNDFIKKIIILWGE